MFYNCNTLKCLELTNFNNQNVGDMSCMFHGCYPPLKKNIKTKDDKFLKILTKQLNNINNF